MRFQNSTCRRSSDVTRKPGFREAGVAAVPFSAFYRDGVKSGVDHFARFCYCKQDSLLDTAIQRLAKHFKK